MNRPQSKFYPSQTSLAENASLSTEQITITATTDQIADEDMTVYFLSNGEGAPETTILLMMVLVDYSCTFIYWYR